MLTIEKPGQDDFGGKLVRKAQAVAAQPTAGGETARHLRHAARRPEAKVIVDFRSKFAWNLGLRMQDARSPQGSQVLKGHKLGSRSS